MILAISGLAIAARAADNGGNAAWQYYAAAGSSYRISDDDDGATSSGGVANAGGAAAAAGGTAQNALYVANSGLSGDIAQTSFFDSGGGCCNGCGCNNCNCCRCDCSTTMARLEWLGWFSRSRNTPPLVTTSPPGTPAATAGVIGFNTRILYGDDPIGENLRNGGRLTLSKLLGDGQTTGTLRFWGIEDGSETFFVSSATNPIIGVPFHALQGVVNQEAAFRIAFPGEADPGQVRVSSKNDAIGLDAWASRSWIDDGMCTVDLLLGYQFARLDDSVALSTLSTSQALSTGFPVGSEFGFFDFFGAKNEFHGASLGFNARSYKGAITLEGLFKLGLGNMRQTVTVAGRTEVDGTAQPGVGGIFAQPTNIGTEVHNHFNIVPEVNANLLYNVNSNWRAMVGYSFIYWNNVVLAGNQIDRNLNLSGGVLPPPVPAPKFQRTDFWVMGISLGADYRW
jgi:hypothetical protein